jgi:catechol 2,3-dioxygenase-like lactoylglutathione lyase family enzyme
MLANSRLQAIIWTADIGKAEHFYSNVLGLTFVKKSHGALVYCVNGVDLRVSPVPRTTAAEHTVLGFSVEDIRAVVSELNSQGIELEKFTNFPHDENGILKIPGGDLVAWFRDPDGNLLSVVEYAVSDDLIRSGSKLGESEPQGHPTGLPVGEDGR